MLVLDEREQKALDPIEGVSTQTFVRNYKGHSQMNMGMVNRVEFSKNGCELMEGILQEMEDFEE